jgi:16S rRNA (guanine527-N7)-methyltransferase
MDVIQKYFPDLSKNQIQQFRQLLPLYSEWNSKINVISRKDFQQLYERHVLHSLGIAKVVGRFTDGTTILDAGTGGGFPGIPLAIFFPDVNFHLADSIGKKTTVVKEIVKSLNLENVTVEKVRVETIRKKYDFIVSRAVTSLPGFTKLISGRILKTYRNRIPNGILYLKGGNFQDELNSINQTWKLYPLSSFFNEPFFETKFVVHIF